MRKFFAALSFALPLCSLAQTAALTEGEAVRLGLTRPALGDLETGAVESAMADAQAIGLPPNPTLGYSQERIRGTLNSTEETWQIAQTFDVSGRRGLRKEAAETRVKVVYASNDARREELAADIRRRFFETLMRQESVRALDGWVRRFTRVERVVEKLSRSGEASGYDRRRLARESQTAAARLSIERAELDRATERLSALIGGGNSRERPLAGTLNPDPLPSLETALVRLEQRPVVQALWRRVEAADLEGRAASRGWIPDITLGVGPKRTDNGLARDTGVIISLSVPLPLFDRQQAGHRRAAAEALNARGELNLIRARAEGDLRGLHRQLERLMATATEYRKHAIAETPELLRIAESAYQGGESSLLELLDAYRGALDAEVTALDLEWKARQARIEYDLLTGSVVK